MPEVWVAGERDAASVASLMLAFRDHIGRDWPSDDQVRATVEALLRDPATEFLLAAAAEGRERPPGSASCATGCRSGPPAATAGWRTST